MTGNLNRQYNYVVIPTCIFFTIKVVQKINIFTKYCISVLQKARILKLVSLMTIIRQLIGIFVLEADHIIKHNVAILIWIF